MIEFRRVDKRQADELFTALPKESKWAEVTGVLLSGHPVFVPLMTRIQLETLRNIVGHRGYGTLRSRTTEMDGVEGRVLRLQRLDTAFGRTGRRGNAPREAVEA